MAPAGGVCGEAGCDGKRMVVGLGVADGGGGIRPGSVLADAAGSSDGSEHGGGRVPSTGDDGPDGGSSLAALAAADLGIPQPGTSQDARGG